MKFKCNKQQGVDRLRLKNLFPFFSSSSPLSFKCLALHNFYVYFDADDCLQSFSGTPDFLMTFLSYFSERSFE